MEKQYFIDSEPKGEVISSKIDQLVAIYTSKFKWAWRGQFLSHTLQILEINQSLEAVKVSDIKKWKRVPFPCIEPSMMYVMIYFLKRENNNQKIKEFERINREDTLRKMSSRKSKYANHDM